MDQYHHLWRTHNGRGGGGMTTVSVAKLPPPPSFTFRPSPLVDTPSSAPPVSHGSSRILPPTSPRLLPTGSDLPLPLEGEEDEDPPPLPPPLATANRMIEMARCDLMWSPSEGEPFTPVQNCEIHPFVILLDPVTRQRFDDDDDVERRKSTLKVHYRWRRGPARAVCFFHPHRTATIQCTTTLRCFCSYPCLERGHRQLRRFYASGGKCPIPRQSNEFSYGVPCRKENASDFETLRQTDETHYKLLRQAGLVVDPDSDQWLVISYSRNFAPRKEDVGHQLRFECAVSSSSHLPHTPTDVDKIHKAESSGGLNDARIVTAGDVAPGPRSSPVDSSLYRKSAREVTSPSEEYFWATWDSTETGTSPRPETYKLITTSCVIPQAPLVESRSIIPVGILALFSGQASAQTPQRVIPPESPLARALGIGLISEKGLIKRKQLQPSPSTNIDIIGSRLTDRFLQQRSTQDSTIQERRETFLTENVWASWGKGSSFASSDAKAGKAAPRVAGHHRIRGVTTKGSPAIGGQHQPPNSDIDRQSGGETFTVMTWNVLADIYATVDAYPYCEPYVLAWNYRRERLLAEILAYNPDVICLQEVQADHFEEFFAPALLRRGYEGLYKQKTSHIFRGSGKQGGGKYLCDGCATFFKVPKFRLLDHFGIEFARVAPPSARSMDSKSDKRLNKDNVALVLCLEQIIVNPVSARAAQQKAKAQTGTVNGTARSENEVIVPTTSTRRLVVANTHILANPEAPDVKIWQANTLTSVLTDYMEKALTFSRMEGNNRVPGLVVCGDFNSTPDSVVYQLVTTGSCDTHHEELMSSDLYKWLREIPLGHGLNLRSSYGAVRADLSYRAIWQNQANYMRIEAERALSANGLPPSQTPQQQQQQCGGGQAGYVLSHGAYEPEFTNYTHQYVGCLDYIFFDDRYLKLTGTLDLLKELQLMEEAHALQLSDWALPSPQRPSDHSPMLSRFEWSR